jgi:signal transduction histidine kinase
MIQVTNFGSPIAANAMQVIFNPLVQVPVVGKSAADRMSTSLGLGLFIVREIVVGHGGTLGVSSSVAGGTIFSIDLPRAFAGDGGIAAGAKNSYEGPVS